MIDLLPPWPLLSAFLLASLVLAVTPGPGVLYILTRSLVQGRRSGLISVAAIALGNLGNALAASIGLAALFAVSSIAFAIVKYAGALYLIYLGIQMLRTPSATHSATHSTMQITGSPAHLFRDGLMVALLNPKTTLFFAAFLPQFLMAQASAISQSMLLGSLFVAIAAITDTVYAMSAGSIAALLHKSRIRNFNRRLGGGIFIGLGLFAAFTDLRGHGKNQ
ncbi:MAG: LysE family translocator [Zetaproteobacteria bacterium CG_4_9_14_3_um_filter_49_83]|nr:MAG: threonine transporter [Zetaproteobacteria bacterium CG1_02_49_23]PIQ33058.1 MAG: threonine transporter [Zetaproteobacteria bacterium CG17_big_fil_post_rev_8_21_14_2_50_50_13]PIV31378.1 MAG: LysE family translocator [Zetaproteobacteria bacterium CG02_land_8_20_14_3_00_50_9]PIY56333.1 MAG: LysE family translocator [Zetaproteobacteria bacterium CG_4_10_14_0_8_um_filter_49_80]PJA35758.1 MAG: LysE family translocator [Zetaproteobacteria bacterium CG_4_9_14_3_um_filter_49_83]